MSEELSLGDSDLYVTDREGYLFNQAIPENNYYTVGPEFYSYYMDGDTATTINYANTDAFTSDMTLHLPLTGITSSIPRYTRTAVEQDNNITEQIENPFKTKEDIFVKIVSLLKSGALFQIASSVRKQLLDGLNIYKKHISEFFDDCRFICDRRNNIYSPANDDARIILDFLFTEKITKEKRTYRFLSYWNRNRDEWDVQVFERFRKQ